MCPSQGWVHGSRVLSGREALAYEPQQVLPVRDSGEAEDRRKGLLLTLQC